MYFKKSKLNMLKNILYILGSVTTGLVLLFYTAAFAQQKADVPLLLTLYSPYDAVNIAYRDAFAVKALNDAYLDTEYIRYIDVRTVARPERLILKAIIDRVLNSCNSKRIKITRTVALPDMSDPVVLRVNLQDYGISTDAWDFLAENGSGLVRLPDPYYHEDIVELIPVEEYENRKVVKKGWFINLQGQRMYGEYYDYEQVKVINKVKKVHKFRPSISITDKDKGLAITSLINLTQTKSPILNGEWFINNATVAPAYYKLIGINGDVVKVDGLELIKGGENQLNKIAGLDINLAKRSQVAAVADTKLVTLHNRVLIRYPTAIGLTGGRYWSSYDTDKGIDDEDYMNRLDKFDDPKIVAKEIIFSLPNGLHMYGVANNKNDLLLKADANVAIHGDSFPSRLQDKQVYSGIRSCALCHEGGYLPIEDKVRSMVKNVNNIKQLIVANVKDEKDELVVKNLLIKLEDAFTPALNTVIDFDNASFVSALVATNDLDPKKNKEYLEKFIFEYYDKFINLDKASLETGWPKDKLLRAIKGEQEFAGFGIGLDYTITAALIADPPVAVSRSTWERQGHVNLMRYLVAMERKLATDKK